MACSNRTVTIIRKYLGVPQVINYLFLSEPHKLMPFWTPILVTITCETSKPQEPLPFISRGIDCFLVYQLNLEQ